MDHYLLSGLSLWEIPVCQNSLPVLDISGDVPKEILFNLSLFPCQRHFTPDVEGTGLEQSCPIFTYKAHKLNRAKTPQSKVNLLFKIFAYYIIQMKVFIITLLLQNEQRHKIRVVWA